MCAHRWNGDAADGLARGRERLSLCARPVHEGVGALIER